MITQALAANGAKVYIAGRREEVIKKSAEVHGGEKVSGEIIPIVMDQNDKESIQAAFKEISSKEKHLNLLVNNAGLASKKIDVATGDKDVELFSKTMLDAPMSDWEDVYKTNVFGYYYVSAAFLPLLVKANKSDPMHKNSKGKMYFFSGTPVSILLIRPCRFLGQHRQHQFHLGYHEDDSGRPICLQFLQVRTKLLFQ